MTSTNLGPSSCSSLRGMKAPLAGLYVDVLDDVAKIARGKRRDESVPTGELSSARCYLGSERSASVGPFQLRAERLVEAVSEVGCRDAERELHDRLR